MALSRLEFFRRVLPDDGVLFLASLARRPDGGTFLRHAAFATAEELDLGATQRDLAGSTVYFACASYVSGSLVDAKGKPVWRVSTNVRLVRSLWCDADVYEPGEDRAKAAKFESRDAAIDGLFELSDLLGLPAPLINESGPNGLHAYWPFTRAVDRRTWKHAARMLKDLAQKLEIPISRERTADESSILRPPGTHHRKNGDYLVSNLTEGEPWEFDRIRDALVAASEAAGVDASPPTTGPDIVLEPGAVDLNKGVGAEFEHTPSSAIKLADECKQIRAFRDQSPTAAITEPHWYAGIQLLMRTTEGAPIVHKWSAGDPRYSAEHTQKKIEQVSGMGPTLCSTFKDRNPAGCEGCPHRGQVATPLQLGYTQFDELPPIQVQINGHSVELENVGAPFERTAQGIFISASDGRKIRISKNDLYVAAEAVDDGTHRRKFCVRHQNPMYGWREDWFDAELLASPTELHKAALNAGVTIDGTRAKPMVQYMTAWLQKLQEKIRAQRHVTSMGWRTDPKGFQVGDRLYVSGEHEPVAAGVSDSITGQLDAFKVVGDMSEWSRLTRELGTPGRVPHAFLVSCGFGAPILGATSYGGGLVVAYGKSNGGKTTAGRFMFGAWGSPLDARDNKSDTINYKIKRLEFYGSIPMYIDEVTNLDPEVLGDFAFSVSQGAGRGRLTADAKMMDKGTWSTIVVASANNSYHQRIAAVPKFDAEARRAMQLRVFEFEIPSLGEERAVRWANEVNRLVAHTYGGPGHVYAQWLANLGKEAVSGMFFETFDTVYKQVGFRPDERYWCAIVTAAVVGGTIAQELGLIHYDPTEAIDWARGVLASLRVSMLEASHTPTSILARFVNDHALGTVVFGDGQIKRVAAAEIVARYETDSRRLYISRTRMKAYISRAGMDYGYVKRALTDSGVVVDTDKRYTLTKGAHLSVSVIEPCWVINTDAAEQLRDIIDEAPQQE